MKILGFAGSNSSKSINKRLVTYVIKTYFSNKDFEILDLNDYEMPIFSIDREENDGISSLAFDFNNKIYDSDFLIVSLAENNGAYSTAFKNIFDWTSRISGKNVFGDKKMFLMSTAPGARGGASVLQIASDRFPREGAIILETFSLPNFDKNFDYQELIFKNKELELELKNKILKIKESI